MSSEDVAAFVGTLVLMSVVMVLIYRAIVWREEHAWEHSEIKYRMRLYERYFVVAERFIDESGVIRTQEIAEACADIVGTESEPEGWNR